MRHATRGRKGADVDEQLWAMLLQELEEFVERPCGVPDGEDYGVRCDGSTAGTRTRLVRV
jgi:hypothetical protein